MEAINELDHYKKLFGVGDVATRAYTAVVKVLEQHIEHLNGFSVKNNIDKIEKDSPTYKRTMEIYESMPEMILKLYKLKNELSIEYIEKEEKVVAMTPQSIAKLSSPS